MANAGTTVGGALAGAIIAFSLTTFGWRPTFIIMGIAGAVWLVFWLILTKDDPNTDARVTAAGRIEIMASSDSATLDPIPLRAYFKHPTVLATAFAFFGLNYILYFFLSWFPSYLSIVHGLNTKELGFISVIPWVCGFTGFLSGCAPSDFI